MCPLSDQFIKNILDLFPGTFNFRGRDFRRSRCGHYEVLRHSFFNEWQTVASFHAVGECFEVVSVTVPSSVHKTATPAGLFMVVITCHLLLSISMNNSHVTI